MKNIHLITTDKASRLLYFGTSKELILQINPATFRTFERSLQHIYITSNEEIISLSEINSLPLSDGKDIQTNMSNI